MILTKNHIGKRVRRPEKNGCCAVEGVVLDVNMYTSTIQTEEFIGISATNPSIGIFATDPSAIGAGEWELVNPPPKPKRKVFIPTRRCARILCKRLRMSYGSWHGLNESETFELLNLLSRVR